MPIEVDGVTYFSAAEVARDVGVSRQTLWRWRNDEKVPAGLRYRDRQILFTEEEFEQVRVYANRLEPANSTSVGQMKLFKSRGGGH